MPLFSGAPNSIQNTLSGYQPGGVLTPGYYSNLAFQMAGRPQNGPYPAVAPPPDPVGGYGIPSGTSGATGGAAGGLLGTLAQNPSLAKTAYNTIGGLLSPAVGTPAWEAAVTSGTSAGIPAATSIAAPTAAEVGASIGAPVSGDLYAGAAGAAGADIGADAAPAADAGATAGDASSLTGGTIMAGIGLLAALGDLYGNSDEKGAAEGQAAQGAINQAQGYSYDQLLKQANLKNQNIYLPSPFAGSGAGQTFGGYNWGGALNPLWQLSSLIGQQQALQKGAPGNSIVGQKVGQTTTGIDPNALYSMLQGYAKNGLLGAGGYGITAQDLAAAGYTPAQISALGLG